MLQGDRQTKGSYTTVENRSDGNFVHQKEVSKVQVSIYDSVDNSNTLVEAPTAS